MGITFEPAQPFAPSISAYYGSAMQNAADAPRLLAARQQAQEMANQARLAGGGGGGGGGGGNWMQDAINQRDQSRTRADEFNAQLETGVQRDQFEAQAQAGLQQQRFNLQAQLQDVELSQQEKMRLQRMKNAVGEVSVDSTLTDQEKSDMILQLKTGIDPFQHRLAAQKLAQETMTKDQMAEAAQARAAFDLQRTKAMGRSLEDRGQWNPDPTALARESSIISELDPSLPPDEVKKRAIAETIRTGQGKQMIMDAKGDFTELDHGHGRASSGKGGTQGAEGGAPEKPAPPFDPSRAYHDAESAVDKLVSAGTIKPEDAEAEIQKRFQARKDAYTQTSGESAQNKKAAEGVGKPAPFDYRDPKAGTDQQKVKIMGFQGALSELAKRPDLDPVVQQKASAALQQAMSLTARFSDPNGRMDGAPTAVKHKLEELKRFIASIPPAPEPQAGAPAARPAFVAGQQVPGQPPGVVYDAQGNMGVWQPGKRSFGSDATQMGQRIQRGADSFKGGVMGGVQKAADWERSLRSYLGVD